MGEIKINNKNLIKEVIVCNGDVEIKDSILHSNTEFVFSETPKIDVVHSVMNNIIIKIENKILNESNYCEYLNSIFRFKEVVSEANVLEDILVLFKDKYVNGYGIYKCKFDCADNIFYID